MLSSRGYWASVLAAAILLAVSGCTEAARPPAEQRDVVRAVVLPFLTQSPFEIAAARGYFEDRGLDVEFVRLARIQDLNAALGQGDVDVAAGMLTVALMNSALEGARLRMVATLGYLDPEQCPFHGWVTRRELLESGVLEAPDRLAGLRFDVEDVLPDGFFLSRALEPLGLRLEDVETTGVPPAAAAEALLSGSLDVTGLPQPFLDMALRNDRIVLWRGSNRLVPGFPISLLMYGPTLLDERPGVGERFLAAMLDAVEQFRRGKTAANLEIVARFTGLDPGQLSDTCWPRPPDSPRVDFGPLGAYVEWAVSRGLVRRSLTEDELVEHRFVDAVNED